MHYALAQDLRRSARHRQRRATEDALDPIRGILAGTLISIVGFWLPLALALTR
ncbi:MAG TPA: hypothetical protein VKV24_14810 [Casimicrobiaceae bacterium]|nr:hypothetical protein [Casimicrobiaceae bacterium]